MTELEQVTKERDAAIAIISTASGVEAPVVAEQVKSDEAPSAAATKLFETKFIEQRDQGDQRATKKTRTEVEKALKDAGVSDAKFSDLPAAIDALKIKAAEDAGKGLTPELALKHPAVVQKLNEVTASIDQKVAAARQEEKQALETERANFSRAQLKAKAQSAAEALVTQLNPVFGDDPAKAATRKRELIERIASADVVEVNGELFQATPDGEVKPDSLGNPVKYADLVRQRTEAAYDLPVAEKRDHVPNGNPAGNQPALKEFKGELPKTQQEYLKLANDPGLSLAAKKELRTAVPELSGG